MFCQKCGKAINDNAVVCPNCGAPNSVNSSPQNIPPNPIPMYTQPTPVPPPKKKRGCLIAVLVFVGFIILLFIIISIGDNVPTDSSNVSTTLSTSTNNETTNITNTTSVSSTTKSPISISALLQKERAIAGERNKIYRIDTNYPNADGSYNVINFETIKPLKTFISNNGTKLNDVILIENVPPIAQTRSFVSDVAYWIAYDKFGEEITVGDIYTQTGKELSEIIIQVPDVDNVKYLLVGGLDKQLYDTGRLIFTVQ